MQRNNDASKESDRNLRKDAEPKTISNNRATFEKIEWPKINKERSFAKAGLLPNVGLLVIKKKGQLVPVWDLREYAFLFSSSIPYTVNPKLWVQGG